MCVLTRTICPHGRTRIYYAIHAFNGAMIMRILMILRLFLVCTIPSIQISQENLKGSNLAVTYGGELWFIQTSIVLHRLASAAASLLRGYPRCAHKYSQRAKLLRNTSIGRRLKAPLLYLRIVFVFLSPPIKAISFSVCCRCRVDLNHARI